MIELKNITKDYIAGTTVIPALRGVSLCLRDSEFVSILGPSGCGKTTLLNIIGGLDRFGYGDLLVDGRSTRGFADKDWDAYRNRMVGFVFQTYNLIGHQSVLDNVAIAMTLSGVNKDERKKRAHEALASVGLEDQAAKRPNQLSGGQMQRVSIARALVNNPKILLCDEPTGALDSVTSVQIMEILKEISKDRLVIMVTHNGELAESYSDRIIRLKDGLVTGDSRPLFPDDTEPQDMAEAEQPADLIGKKTAMSWWTAIKLSFKNLMTKKARTIMTSVAGSIGIIGVALVLAISNGMTKYVSAMQSNALAGFPITISRMAYDMSISGMQGMLSGNNLPRYPDDKIVKPQDNSIGHLVHHNKITDEYVQHVKAVDKSLYNAISYAYDIKKLFIAATAPGIYQKVPTEIRIENPMLSMEMPIPYFGEIPNSKGFVETQYDVLEGNYPTAANEMALVVDQYNRLDKKILEALHLSTAEEYPFSDLMNIRFKAICVGDMYLPKGDGTFLEQNDLGAMYQAADSLELKVTAIMRIKKEATGELLGNGIAYTAALTEALIQKANTSEIAMAQAAEAKKGLGTAKDVLTNDVFKASDTDKMQAAMQKIGADTTPVSISIYPVSFASKSSIKSHLDCFNIGKAKTAQIRYTDAAEVITSATSTLINAIAVVLAAVAAISLVVSTIMIGIITYVSVVERTKEIGILRAIGARKRDVTRIFNAETLLIGFAAGVLGVLITYLLSIPINLIVASLVGITTIASLPVWYALALIAGSMVLTLIGGFLPARGAAKKDPVVALRAE